jgi:hypothetical protein
MACFAGRLAAIFFMLAMVPAAANAVPPNDPAPPAVDTISYVSGMWGWRTDQWAIRADGSGEVRSRDETSPEMRDPILVVRRFQADPALFQQVRALMRVPEAYAERVLPCGEIGTDAPGAQLRWTFDRQSRQLGFAYGCRSEEAGPVYEAIRAASALVRSQVDGRGGERHRSSELPDIDPTTITLEMEGKPK